MVSLFVWRFYYFSLGTQLTYTMFAEIKHRMKNDVDEGLKVARTVKSKLEALDKDVCCFIK